MSPITGQNTPPHSPPKTTPKQSQKVHKLATTHLSSTQSTTLTSSHLKTSPVAKAKKSPPNTSIDIFEAVKTGDLATVQFYIEKKDADPNQTDEYDYTPLHWAAAGGHLEVVKHLISVAKANPNRKDYRGRTPLHWAAAGGNLEVVKYLISVAKADPNRKDYRGRTPLHWAAAEGNLEVVKCLVSVAKVDHNLKDKYDSTPLHVAAKGGHLDIVKHLISIAKANPNLKDNSGNTPLSLAAIRGHLDIVKCLVSVAKVDHNLKDKYGNTPLHWAAVKGHLEVVKYLVSVAKANPNQKKKNGSTPLYAAGSGGHLNVVKWLILHAPYSSTVLNDSLYKFQSKLKIPQDIFWLAIKRAERRKRLKLVTEQTSALKQYVINYKVLAQQLTAAVAKLSLPDRLWHCKQQIHSQLETIASIKLEKVPYLLKPLLKQCLPPHRMLCIKFSSWKKRKLHKDGSFFSEHPAFKNIHRLVKDIRSCLKKIPPKSYFASVKRELENLALYYEGYCTQLCSAKTDKERKLLRCAPARILKRDAQGKIVQELLKDKVYPKLFTNNSEYGTHQVFSYEGVHYKMFPRAPGIESAVDSLNNMVAGTGSSPTQLLKLIDRKGKHYALLASKTVFGVELQDLVVQHKHLIEKLDLNNFSKMIVMSLLTNPQDGKPDNYMVKFQTDEKGEITTWQIIGVDNDMAFAPSLVKRVQIGGKPIHVALIRNVLYFFPQMKKTFDETFFKEFVHRSPELILIEWLLALYQKNAEYQALIDQGVFHPLEYSGNEAVRLGKKNNTPYAILDQINSPGGLQLPIRLAPRSGVVLFRRICLIQAMLKKNPKTTHEEIFKYLEPDLHAHYATVFKEKDGDIFKSIAHLYDLWNQVLEKKGIAPFKNDELKKLVTQENLSSFTKIAISSANNSDFEKTRTQSIREITEEWIASLNWERYPPKEEQLYLQHMQKLQYITHLSFSKCQAISDVNLISYLDSFKQLQTLSLRKSTPVTLAGVRNLLNFNKKISVRLDVQALKLPPKEIYLLAKEFTGRVSLLYKETLISFGRRLEQPHLLLERLIQGNLNSKALFDILIYTFKAQPSQDIHLNMQYRDSSSFLHQAAHAKNDSAYQWLLAAGVNASLKDSKGKTAAALHRQDT